MAKKREFKDYTATVKDRDGDEHKHSVKAHVVTEDTRGVVTTRVGAQEVYPNDVLVETSQPHVYDVHNSDAWGSTGYAEDSSDDEPDDGFGI